MGEVALAVEAADEERALRSLHDWLSREAEFRGKVSLRRAEVGPDRMGSVLDVLTVALGAGGAGVALAGSLRAWVAQQRSNVKLRIVRADESRVEIDVSNVEDVDTLVKQLMRNAR